MIIIISQALERQTQMFGECFVTIPASQLGEDECLRAALEED